MDSISFKLSSILIGAMPYAAHDGHGFKPICVPLVSITTSKEGVTPIFLGEPLAKNFKWLIFVGS